MDQCLIISSKATVICTWTGNMTSLSCVLLKCYGRNKLSHRWLETAFRVLEEETFWIKPSEYVLKSVDDSNSHKYAQKNWTGQGNNELSYSLQVWPTIKITS